jgi:hypothetical protein
MLARAGVVVLAGGRFGGPSGGLLVQTSSRTPVAVTVRRRRCTIRRTALLSGARLA